MDALTEISGSPLEHPPYSPDFVPMRFLGFSNHENRAPKQEIFKWSKVCSTFSRSGWSVVRNASLAKGGTSKERPSSHLHKVPTRSNKESPRTFQTALVHMWLLNPAHGLCRPGFHTAILVMPHCVPDVVPGRRGAPGSLLCCLDLFPSGQAHRTAFPDSTGTFKGWNLQLKRTCWCGGVIIPCK
jgi:hypothetical protein